MRVLRGSPLRLLICGRGRGVSRGAVRGGIMRSLLFIVVSNKAQYVSATAGDVSESSPPPAVAACCCCPYVVLPGLWSGFCPGGGAPYPCGGLKLLILYSDPVASCLWDTVPTALAELRTRCCSPRGRCAGGMGFGGWAEVCGGVRRFAAATQCVQCVEQSQNGCVGARI
jgi:hypothetical protein